MNTSHIELNMEAAMERMGDREIYLEIALFFADQIPFSLEQLDEALEKGSMGEARRFAHSMKSNCATVGADALREECYALEKACLSENIAAARKAFISLRPRLEELRRILKDMS